MSFIRLASLSLFKPDIWACVLGLRAYYFKLNRCILISLSYLEIKISI